MTGDHNRHTQASTYVENQTVVQSSAGDQDEAVRELLGAMTGQTMSFMMTIQFARVQPTSEHVEAMNAAYHVWEVESAMNETKLLGRR